MAERLARGEFTDDVRAFFGGGRERFGERNGVVVRSGGRGSIGFGRHLGLDFDEGAALPSTEEPMESRLVRYARVSRCPKVEL